MKADGLFGPNTQWALDGLIDGVTPYFAKVKPGFVPRKDKRKGSDDRQPSGSRERNVGHPEGEEHSRVAKGSKGQTKRSDTLDDVGTGILIGGAAISLGYLIYRGVRILPSLLPPLWWTIPANIAIP